MVYVRISFIFLLIALTPLCARVYTAKCVTVAGFNTLLKSKMSILEGLPVEVVASHQ